MKPIIAVLLFVICARAQDRALEPKPGQILFLKGGTGPALVFSEKTESGWYCKWFEDGKLQCKPFKPEELTEQLSYASNTNDMVLAYAAKYDAVAAIYNHKNTHAEFSQFRQIQWDKFCDASAMPIGTNATMIIASRNWVSAFWCPITTNTIVTFDDGVALPMDMNQFIISGRMCDAVGFHNMVKKYDFYYCRVCRKVFTDAGEIERENYKALFR